MSNTLVARRYADALFQLAVEKNSTDQLVEELNIVKEVIEKDDNVLHVLTHPRIEQTQKLALIESAFSRLNKDIVNTLKLLIQRDRIDMVLSVINDFIASYNELNGIAVATVYSTRPLTDAEQANVAQTFKTKLNKQMINIENEIDPSLIGGLRIRIGNTIYDGSISNQLNRFKANLVSASK